MITLQTIGLITKDMEKTIDFYRTLGLDIPNLKIIGPNYDFPIDGGPILGFLDEGMARKADPNFNPTTGSLTLNLQFMVPTPELVDETYQRLVSKGYASYARPWDAVWGQRFARVVDPDGRVVNIYAHLEER